jgi:hypothetical protein
MSLNNTIIANITTNCCYFNKPLLVLKNGKWQSTSMWNYPEFFNALLSTLNIRNSQLRTKIMLNSVNIIKRMNPPLWNNKDDYHNERVTMLNYYINECFHVKKNDLQRLVSEAIVPSINEK